MIKIFDYNNDIEYNGYLLYKNKLINARTYELLIDNDIKILPPKGFTMEQLVSINRKNKILHNKKDFESYKFSFKEYRFIDGFSYLVGINKALKECENAFGLQREYVLTAVTLFGFQVFTRNDANEILEKNGFNSSVSVFRYLLDKGYLIRIDNLPEKTKYLNRIFCFSDKGAAMVKMFYDTVEKTNFYDFKFKNKSQTLVDNILKKYE